MTETDCTSCPQAKNFERLEREQKGIVEKAAQRDNAIADIKLDTAVTKEKVMHTAENVSEIKTTVLELKNQPAKNWQDLIKIIMTVLATAAITLLLSKQGGM